MSRVIKAEAVKVSQKSPFVLDLQQCVTNEEEQRGGTAKKQAGVERKKSDSIAKERVNEAEKQIMRMMEQAKKQLDAEREVARREGLRSGRQMAKQELEVQREEMAGQFAALVQDFKQQFTAIYQDLTDSVLELSLAVACKILQKDLARDGQAIQALVENVLEKSGKPQKATLKLNPNDLIWVQEMDLANYFTEAEQIRLNGEPGLASGSCVLISENGTIEASVKSQLDKIKKDLEESET